MLVEYEHRRLWGCGDTRTWLFSRDTAITLFDHAVLRAHGGQTWCMLLGDPENDITPEYIGVADCSVRDNYCRRTGRLISYARARWAVENCRVMAGYREIGYPALRSWAAERGLEMPEEAPDG